MAEPSDAEAPAAREAGGDAAAPRGSLLPTVLLGVAMVIAFAVGGLGVLWWLDRDAGAVDAADAPIMNGPQRLDAPRPAPDDEAPLPADGLWVWGGDDEPLDLDVYEGRPLVVNFWASWCDPCIAEMPDLQQVAEERADEVTVLGINVQDAPSSAAGFVDDLGITYDLARDPDASYFQSVGGFGMPTTLLVDADGQIVYRHTGLLDAAELSDLVDARLSPVADR